MRRKKRNKTLGVGVTKSYKMWTIEVSPHIPRLKEVVEGVIVGAEAVEGALGFMGNEEEKICTREAMTSSMWKRNGTKRPTLTTRRSTWTCGSDGRPTPGLYTGKLS